MKTNWISIERRIRAILRMFYRGQMLANEAIKKIDEVLAEETNKQMLRSHVLAETMIRRVQDKKIP